MAEERTTEREEELAKAAAEGRIRLIAAACGAAVSVGLLLVYYLPGLRENHDADDIFLLMAVPAAALMLPWALLALFLRVKTVWILCGLLMLYAVGQASADMGNDADEVPSIFAFFFTFVANLFYVGLATIIDLAIRGARRVRRA